MCLFGYLIQKPLKITPVGRPLTPALVAPSLPVLFWKSAYLNSFKRWSWCLLHFPSMIHPPTPTPRFLVEKTRPLTTGIRSGPPRPWKTNRIKRDLNLEDKCNSSFFNERQACIYILGCIRGHAFYLLKCREEREREKKEEQGKGQSKPHRWNPM